MGQHEVGTILEKAYPRYLTCLDIMRHINISQSSLYRCLKSLKKRDEVELKVIQGSKLKSGWITGYRLKKEEKE